MSLFAISLKTELFIRKLERLCGTEVASRVATRDDRRSKPGRFNGIFSIQKFPLPSGGQNGKLIVAGLRQKDLSKSIPPSTLHLTYVFES